MPTRASVKMSSAIFVIFRILACHSSAALVSSYVRLPSAVASIASSTGGGTTDPRAPGPAGLTVDSSIVVAGGAKPAKTGGERGGERGRDKDPSILDFTMNGQVLCRYLAVVWYSVYSETYYMIYMTVSGGGGMMMRKNLRD